VHFEVFVCGVFYNVGIADRIMCENKLPQVLQGFVTMRRIAKHIIAVSVTHNSCVRRGIYFY